MDSIPASSVSHSLQLHTHYTITTFASTVSSHFKLPSPNTNLFNMLFNNVLTATVLAFASVGMASPVPLSGDIASANIESANAGPVIE
jgi:hypothetical protein